MENKTALVFLRVIKHSFFEFVVLRRCLLEKGAITQDDLNATREAMQAQLEVEKAFDPEVADLFDMLEGRLK